MQAPFRNRFREGAFLLAEKVCAVCGKLWVSPDAGCGLFFLVDVFLHEDGDI